MRGEAISLATISLDDFAPLVGTKFELALEEGGSVATQLVLTEATPGKYPRPGGRQPFSLTFEGPASIELPQQTYWLTHPTLGTLGIFMVPVGADAECRRYEAVFN